MSIFRKIWESPRLFSGVSWGVTAALVLSLLGFTVWQITPASAQLPPEPTPGDSAVPTPIVDGGRADYSAPAIVRQVTLKTVMDRTVIYKTIEYTVRGGDSVFGIAKNHNIKPETLLWANYDVLQDSPDSIRAGQVLKIPPVDGVYYQWQEGDTLAAVADEFGSTVDDILSFPGNNIDLSSPDVSPGTYVMIPDGHREFVQWLIPDVAAGRSGTANVNGSACGGGPQGGGAFIWPTANHYLSGNEYWSGHLGIDIAAGTGAPIWAAGAGVVTMAQGGWNYGYGNVVMIDHGYDALGNHWVTLYGHLSQINVTVCQSVAAGQLIGLAGSTGNSFGAHLHFEVRENGGFINPWYVLPTP
jgi:murein DD-endopeptidase MepM/ murein hydrolase activator NlpD